MVHTYDGLKEVKSPALYLGHYSRLLIAQVNIGDQPMPAPAFDTYFLPLLTFLGDGEEHSRQEMIDKLAADFDLTYEDRTQLLASGEELVFYRRVDLAVTYLRKAQLVAATRRTHFQITRRGIEVLAQGHASIDL